VISKYTIIRRQSEDPFITKEICRIEEGRPSKFRLGDFNSLRFHDRICVLDIPEIKELILKEAHETPYSIHPGSTRMYMDLKELFWWNNMKREIAMFVSECHTCQRVKAEHQSPAGLMQPLNIPEWTWCRGDDFQGRPRAEPSASRHPRNLHGARSRGPASTKGPAVPVAGWRLH
jgi:hypothetical protein